MLVKSNLIVKIKISRFPPQQTLPLSLANKLGKKVNIWATNLAKKHGRIHRINAGVHKSLSLWVVQYLEWDGSESSPLWICHFGKYLLNLFLIHFHSWNISNNVNPVETWISFLGILLAVYLRGPLFYLKCYRGYKKYTSNAFI